eukprot:scaffold62125_cov14-Tisochrysis_lutea.AAC.1
MAQLNLLLKCCAKLFSCLSAASAALQPCQGSPDIGGVCWGSRRRGLGSLPHKSPTICTQLYGKRRLSSFLCGPFPGFLAVHGSQGTRIMML